MGDLWDFDESPTAPPGTQFFDAASSPAPTPQPLPTEEALDGHSKELEQAKIALAAAQAEVAATKVQSEQEVNTIKEQARELKTKAKEAIDKANDDNAALREQIAQMSATAKDNDTEDDGKAQLAAKDAELAHLRQELSTLAVEKNAVEETAKAENAEKLTQYQVRFDQLQAQVTMLQDELNAKTTEVRESQGKLAHVETSYAANTAQIRMELKGKEDEIVQLQGSYSGENKALKDEIAALNSAQQSEHHTEDESLQRAQEAEIALLRMDVAGKDATIESMKSDAEGAVGALSNENILLKEEIAVLKAAQLESTAQQANLLQEKEAEIAQLRDGIIEAQKSKAEGDTGPLAEEIAKLNEAQAAREAEIAQLQQDATNKNAVIEAMKSETEGAANALSNENTLLKDEIATLKAAQLKSDAQQASLLEEKEISLAQLRRESADKDAALKALTSQTESDTSALAEENATLKKEIAVLRTAQRDSDIERRNLLEAQDEIARLREEAARKDAAMETMTTEAEEAAGRLASENTALIKDVAALTQAQIDANAERKEVMRSHEEKIAQLQEQLRLEQAKSSEASAMIAVPNGPEDADGAGENSADSEKVTTLEQEIAILSSRAVDAETSAAKLAEEVSSMRVRHAISTGELETRLTHLTEQLRAKDKAANEHVDAPLENAEKAALEAQILALRDEVSQKERENEDLQQQASGIFSSFHSTMEAPKGDAQQELATRTEKQKAELQRVRSEKEAAEAQVARLTAQIEQMMTAGAVAAVGTDTQSALQDKEREIEELRESLKAANLALEDMRNARNNHGGAAAELSQAKKDAQVLRKEAHDANETREKMSAELSLLRSSAVRNESATLDRVCRRLRQLFSDELGPLDNDRAMTHQKIEPLLEDVKGAADKIRLERKHLSTLVESLRSENAKLRAAVESHTETPRDSFFTNLYKCRWMSGSRHAKAETQIGQPA